MADRPISMTIMNQLSDVSLLFADANAQHGTTPKVIEGPNPIPAGGQATVYAENTGLIGPEGTFQYQFEDGSGRAFDFAYNHPYGSGETTVNVTPPSGYTYSMTVNHLAHHDASCTLALQQLA